jgi:hypothetical protein
VIRCIGIVLLGLPLYTGLLIQGPAVAETWPLGTLPTKPTKLGYVMTIQLEAVSGNGYQPIHLNFGPTGKAFQRDHHVEVTFTPVYDYSSIFQYTYRTSMTVPEGLASYSKTVYVPHYYDWKNINVELREDGQPVEWGIHGFGTGGNLRFGFANQRVTVGIIQPRDAAAQDAAWKVYPDVRTLVTVLGEGPIPEEPKTSGPNKSVENRLDHQQAMNLAKQVQPAWVQFRPIHEDKLPETWLGYSQLDMILAPAPVMDRMVAEQPARMDELKFWLAAGGNLWLYAAKQGNKVFTDSLSLQPIAPELLVPARGIQRLLDLSAKNDTSKLVADGFNSATKESLHYSYQNNERSMSIRRDVFKNLEKAEHPFAETKEAKELATGLQRGSFGLGEIITTDSEDPFPGSFQHWKSIALLQGPTRLHWPDRNGVDVPKGNDNYWSWLIRSVGQPPVKSFVLLNLLFAIFIGPVCYRFLRRRQRLYLLYFVAPCVAVLVTGSLFAYAILIDGVTTKQRTRQLTWIDAVNQYNVSQSRSTYYRVLGYGQQVAVPNDTAIYPVRHSPVLHGYYARNSSESRLHGSYTDAGDRQLLGGGFLPTRSQVQYLATQPRKSDESVDVDWDSGTVTNRLQQTIQRLIVSDSDGKYWEVSDLTSQSSVKLQPCPRADKALAQMLGPKVLPKETEIPMLNNYSWAQNSTVSHQSLLEQRLERWSRDLPANSFIGLAEIDSQRLGVLQARVLDSVHVIMGTLP